MCVCVCVVLQMHLCFTYSTARPSQSLVKLAGQGATCSCIIASIPVCMTGPAAPGDCILLGPSTSGLLTRGGATLRFLLCACCLDPAGMTAA